MTTLREDIIIGVASLLAPNMNLDFSKESELEWLCQAILMYGQEGWRYHASESGSNYYRFKVWLLHIEAHVRIKYLHSIKTDMYQIEDEMRWFHKKVMELLETIKGFD